MTELPELHLSKITECGRFKVTIDTLPGAVPPGTVHDAAHSMVALSTVLLEAADIVRQLAAKLLLTGNGHP